MEVSIWPVGGGERGFVELVGSIADLMVGGQEFMVDNICVSEAQVPTGCDYEVNHQSLGMGDAWGGSYGNVPDDFMFTEDGINVFATFFNWPSGGTFGNCRVEPSPDASFGFDKVMAFNNINNYYDLTGLGIAVSQVSFEYLDLGGFENLEVNGATMFVDELTNMPAAVAPGVTMSVTTWPVSGGERGLVVLTGDVQKLQVGGQEFFLDNLCVEQAGNPLPDICTHVVDNESQDPGGVWGDPYGEAPGDVIFVEDGIEVGLFLFDHGSGMVFGEAGMQSPVCGVVDGNAMWLNNITVGYLLAGVAPVNYARFDYCDCGGIENLRINDELWVGEFENIPAGYFGSGITVTVTEGGSGSCRSGSVVIEGDLERVGVGGQELQVDNFCVGFDGVSAVGADLQRAGLTLRGNHPNPFNPSTTIAFSLERDGEVELAVYDLAGRRVATLLDGLVPAGNHEVFWNGRDQAGRTASAGMYLVQLRDENQVVSRKMTMVK